jgi:hypothetical protein
VYDYWWFIIVGIVSETIALERLHNDNDFPVFFSSSLYRGSHPGVLCGALGRGEISYWADCTVLLFRIKRFHKLPGIAS